MKNLLVAVDFSDVTNRVLEKASEIAIGAGAKVWLLHCVERHASLAAMSEVPMAVPLSEPTLPARFPGIHLQLSELCRSLQRKGVEAEMLFVAGAVTQEILKAVNEHQIDLIFMGSRGHSSLYDLVVGSNTKSVLYYTSTPTVIVPGEQRSEKIEFTANQWEEPMATPY